MIYSEAMRLAKKFSLKHLNVRYYVNQHEDYSYFITIYGFDDEQEYWWSGELLDEDDPQRNLNDDRYKSTKDDPFYPDDRGGIHD